MCGWKLEEVAFLVKFFSEKGAAFFSEKWEWIHNAKQKNRQKFILDPICAFCADFKS